MATLVVHAAGAAPSFVTLVKPLTTLAAAPDSDVRVPNLRGVVAIEFDGESFTATALEGAQLVVNGKRRGKHTLADGDTMELGSTQLVFQSGERVPAPAQVHRNEQRDPQSLATSRLAEFARQLASEPGVDTALTRLLDALIEVVRADKGFVLVVNDGTPQVLKARNFQRENVADAVERLSDTIVRRVLETRQPLCIEDALHDSQFNASESVVNLKLASVMCLPLVMRGELLGAIYVGNDKLGALGRALAAEFTLGGATPLWTLLSSTLVIERIGPAKQRADAVVVVRTVAPQQDGTARFLTGLLGGLGVGGTAVVGVEATGAQPSAVPGFSDRGLSSVDDVDQLVGRFALALLLSGVVHGQYGVKDTASAVLPPVEPVTIAPK